MKHKVKNIHFVGTPGAARRHRHPRGIARSATADAGIEGTEAANRVIQ